MNASQRKTLFSCLIMALLCGWALMLSGCKPPPPVGNPAIIGKWGIECTPVMEIQADCTWVDLSKKKDPDIISTKWNWDGTNYIRLTHKTKVKEAEKVEESLRV